MKTCDKINVNKNFNNKKSSLQQAKTNYITLTVVNNGKELKVRKQYCD